MKPVLAAVCCALVCFDSLATDYAQERALRVVCELELELETTDYSMEIDGEPVEGRGGGADSTDVRRIVRVDRFLEHEGGVPTRVRRSYEEVEGSASMTFGDQERELDLESTLEGAVLELERGEDGEVRVTVAEGDPSSEAIDRQRLELFLDALLPGKDVGAGDSWTLEDEAVRGALGIDRLRAAFAPADDGEEEGGGGRGRGRWGGGGSGAALFGAGDWSGRATLSADSEEHAGLECAVVQLELESRGELEERPGGGRGRAFGLGAAGLVETTYEIELEGRLLVSKTERRPVLLELTGPARIESESERETRRGHTRTRSVREGTWTQRFELTLVE